MKCLTAFISGYPSCIISDIRGNIELIWWRILFCVKADPAIVCCFCCDTYIDYWASIVMYVAVRF